MRKDKLISNKVITFVDSVDIKEANELIYAGTHTMFIR